MRKRPTADRRRPRLLATAALAPLVLAGAASAAAAPAAAARATASPVARGPAAVTPGVLIKVDKPCYVRTGPAAPRMTLTGSGFASGAQVTITDTSGTLDATTTSDATGAIDATFAGPSLILKTPGEVKDTITATQPTTTGTDIVATTTTEVSILGAGHGSTKSEPGLRALTETTNWVFSGWPAGKTLYVHYLVKHRAVARESFGRPSAPCGVLHARRRLYPSTPHASSYSTQIDNVKRYSASTRPRFTLLLVGLELEY